MPAETRKKKEIEQSLVDKVRQLSPGSHSQGHASLGIATGITTPEISRTRPTSGDTTLEGHADLDKIYQLIVGVKDSLDAHKQSVENQIKQLSDNFHAHLDTKLDQFGQSLKKEIKDSVEDLQQYVDSEVGRITSQINDVVARVTTLEQRPPPEEKPVPDFDPEVSIIMSKVPQNQDENIQEVVEKIIHEGLEMPEVRVVRAMRMRPRGMNRQHGRPGPRQIPLVKVQLEDLETKKQVLRNKLKVQTNTTEFTNVWMRSSKPHIERLIDLNFKTMLDMIPGGDTMTVTNSGRIVKKSELNNN